jgi:cytochrome P450
LGPVWEVMNCYAGSIVGWRRKALKDTEVGGVAIEEGSQLLLLMGSANRDESKFETGGDFDISRLSRSCHKSGDDGGRLATAVVRC